MMYSTTRIVTSRRMVPEAEAQSPVRKVSSTTEMAFCMNTEGIELTMALMRMQAMVMGSSTG